MRPALYLISNYNYTNFNNFILNINIKNEAISNIFESIGTVRYIDIDGKIKLFLEDALHKANLSIAILSLPNYLLSESLFLLNNIHSHHLMTIIIDKLKENRYKSIAGEFF